MGPSKNVYASVKSYSQRGKLLKREDYQMLSESRNLDELVTRMRNTVYEGVVSDTPKPYTARGIESVIWENLANRHYSISRAAGKSPILDAYYMKFTAYNLKAILKGKALNKTQEEIEPHVNLRAEELLKQRDVVVKALVAKDLEEAAASLAPTRFGDDVARAVAAYGEGGNLQAFDTHFDKIVYRHLGRARIRNRDREVAKIIDLDIDSYNLLSVIRGKFWRVREEAMEDLLVPPTPSAPSELLSRMMATETVRDALAEVANTKYRGLVPQAKNDMDALAEFERALGMRAYTICLRSFTKIFNFATIIAITKLTTYETGNLGAIAYAVEQGIPSKRVMSKLVLSPVKGASAA